ncbi:MAG: hypothetical protein JW844_07900 [Candidatus Omnitrophica bacterium]|nr:hypothetical protein [Candidatus Omnitrophota bacterium]
MKKKILFTVVVLIFLSILTAIAVFSVSENQYINDNYRISITGPSGWKMQEQPSRGTLVSFTKGPSTLPGIAVAVDVLGPEQKTSLDFAQDLIAYYTTTMKATMIEAPKEVQIQGMQGSSFILKSPEGPKGAFILKQYLIEKDHKIVSIMYTAFSNAYDRYSHAFEQTVQTFRFLSPRVVLKEFQACSDSSVAFKSLEQVDYKPLKQECLVSMANRETFEAILIVQDRTKSELEDDDYVIMQSNIQYNSPADFEIYVGDFLHNVGDIWRVVGDDIYVKIGTWVPMPSQTDNPEINKIFTARKQSYQSLSFEKYVQLLRDEEPVGIAQNVQGRYTVLRFQTNDSAYLIDWLQTNICQSEIIIWIDNKDKTIAFVKTHTTGVDENGKNVDVLLEHLFNAYNVRYRLGIPEMPWKDK